ncbi:MAG: tetratricopeptide repeat protein [Bacteroidales bacterium]|nr:tetratricopeptide repeat protein [Bacteroidales bacterium]
MRKRIAGFLVVSLALLVMGCNAPSNLQQAEGETQEKEREINREVRSFYLDGSKEMVLENYEKAKSLFEKALDRDSVHAPSHYQLARIYKKNNDWKQAERHIRKASKAKPDNKWYKIEFAKILKTQQEFEEAISVYNDVIEDFSNRPDLYLDIAQLYMMVEDYQKAIEALDNLEKLVGVHKRLTIQKQKLYLKLDKPQEAVEEIQKLIENNPQNVDYHNMLANLYVKTKQYTKAREAYEKVMQIDSANAHVHINLADLYKKQGKEDSAFRELKRGFRSPALDLQSKVQILTSYYSVSEMYSDQKAQAFSLAKILVETHPNESNSHAIYADFLFKDERLDKAEKQFEKAIELNSSKFYNWESYLNILLQNAKYEKLKEKSIEAQELFPMQPTPYLFAGIAELQTEDLEKAKNHLLKGQEMVADNEQLELQFHTYLGEVYNELGQYDKSDKYFNRAIDMDPSNSFTLNNYSYYLALRGEKLELAKEYAKKAVKIDSGNPNNQDTYGWVLFKMGRYEEAKFWIQKAMKTSNNPGGTILEHMGDVLYEMGKTDKAVEYWKKAKKQGDTTKFIDKKIDKRKRITE